MTSDTSSDVAHYYTNPGYSPNGRYIVFYSRRLSPKRRLHIMTADGSPPHVFGDWSQIEDRGYTWKEGVWSKDSRYYYSFKARYYIEVPTNKVRRLPAGGFYWPFLSPDGRILYGLSIISDSESGGTLKFIRTDGTQYREFPMPYKPGSRLDVTHGWLGNDHVWCWIGSKPHRIAVMRVQDGSLAGFLNVRSDFMAKFGHMTMSPDAYALGNGAGLIAGHSRTFEFANTKFWTRHPKEREWRPIFDKNKYPAFEKPKGTHSNFSPDGKWLVLENVTSDPGKMSAYPVDKNSSPIWLVRFRPRSKYTGGSAGYRPYHWPTWSPDGTKVLFWSDSMREPDNGDLYVVVFKKPDPPTNLHVKRTDNGRIALTWNPAGQHREVKEYEIFRASSKDGQYQEIGVVPETYTYLEAPSKISRNETTIFVDTTEGFPSQGVIRIMGLSTSQPKELVSYTGKTANSFTGCRRGINGTQAAEHWNDAFVWKYTGEHGYRGEAIAGTVWYKARSVEWSGLKGRFSEGVMEIQGLAQDGPFPANTCVEIAGRLQGACLHSGDREGSADDGRREIGDGSRRARLEVSPGYP